MKKNDGSTVKRENWGPAERSSDQTTSARKKSGRACFPFTSNMGEEALDMKRTTGGGTRHSTRKTP